MSALDTVARFVSPEDMRAILRTTPSYNVNRDRVGALVHDGLAAYDQYQKAKPYLFWGSLLGAGVSAYYFNARGRKPDNREAMVLYGASFAICAVTAFITRPIGAKGKPADADPAEPDSTDGAFVQWVDGRVVTLKQQDPNFADKSLGRLVGMPGIKQQFQQMNPLIRAAVV